MGYPTVNNVPLDQIFDPYVSGTKAAITGYKVNGVDLKDIFAPIYLGASAAITGYKVNGSDLNTIFAKKGTAQYALPINGNSYTGSYLIPISGAGFARIGFRILTGNTYQVYSQPNGGSATSLASGPVPTGAVTVRYTWGTYEVPSGSVDAGGGVTNGAATPTAISSNPLTYYSTANVGSQSGSRGREYPFTIDFFNAGGTNISSTLIYLTGSTEGSV